MTKATESQKRANKKWRQNNREHVKYLDQRSKGLRFLQVLCNSNADLDRYQNALDEARIRVNSRNDI